MEDLSSEVLKTGLSNNQEGKNTVPIKLVSAVFILHLEMEQFRMILLVSEEAASNQMFITDDAKTTLGLCRIIISREQKKYFDI